MTITEITYAPLDYDDILRRITTEATGAACIFAGMVRGRTERADAVRPKVRPGEPHETVRLEYEAYTPMAEEKMAQVAQEIRERWPTMIGIAIVQRVGVMEPGAPTVGIACSSAHRDTGVFEAARYGIDRLKEVVPIWKKEIGSRGEVWVEGSYQPQATD